jgi:UDP-N-acetylmuramoylalanine--D-glutamate ligase
VVLNADNARAAEAAARSHAPGLLVFSIEHPVAQGAWAGERQRGLSFRAGMRRSETIMPLAEFRSRARTTWRTCWPRCAPRGWPGAPASDSPRRREASRPSSIAWNTWPPSTASSYYNDSKATNVDATAKAVAAFPGGIHLILGGKDKAPTTRSCATAARARARRLHHRRGGGQNRVATARRGPITPARRWTNAVSAAASAARPGEVVLLAPACSSFDQFETTSSAGSSSASSRNWSANGGAWKVWHGKTRRRRQVAVLHHAAAGGGRAGDGLFRLGRGRRSAITPLTPSWARRPSGRWPACWPCWC